MQIKILNEQPFQILSTNFTIGSSESGYTLYFSADGSNYSPLFTVAPNTERMVTDMASGAYYKLINNTGEVVINWNRSCGGGSIDEIPIATTTRLGAIKVGNGLSIDANGVLSATGGEGGSVPTFDLQAIFAMSDEEKAAMFPTIKAAIESGSFIAYGALESEDGTLCFANKAAVEGDDRVFFECYGSHYSQPNTIMVRTYRLSSNGHTVVENFSAEVGGGGSSLPSVYYFDLNENDKADDAMVAEINAMYDRVLAGDRAFSVNLRFDWDYFGGMTPVKAVDEGNGEICVYFNFTQYSLYYDEILVGKVGVGDDYYIRIGVRNNGEGQRVAFREWRPLQLPIYKGGSTALNLNDIKTNWSDEQRIALYNELVTKFTNGEYFNATFKGKIAGEYRLMGNPCINYDDGYGSINFNFYCEYGGMRNYFIRINRNGGFEDLGV